MFESTSDAISRRHIVSRAHKTKSCEHQHDRLMVRVPGASRYSTMSIHEVVS